MFGKGMYLSVFYCLCYVMYISIDMFEEQVSEKKDLDLNENEDFRMDEIRDKNWRYAAEGGYDKKNFHALMWEVYVKEKEDFIKIDFLVSVPHLKGGDIVWTYVKDNIINDK